MSNQFFHSIWVVLLTACTISAQNDTTFNTVSQESGVFAAQPIATPLEQAFGTYVPARLMFKATIGNALEPDFTNNPGNFSLSMIGRPVVVGAEYKLSPSWSVGAYYGLNVRFFDRLDGESVLSTGLLQADTRWYYQQKKRIRAGKSANNFSDNYVAAELNVRSTRFNGETASESALNRYQWNLRWGLQRRWVKNGYFDYSVGVGQIANRFDQQWSDGAWTFDQRFALGFARFWPKQQRAQAIDACNVLHCFDEQRSMLKINAYNVLTGYWADNKLLSLSPTVAYEHKIGKSPFSVEGTLGANYSVGKWAVTNDQYWRQQTMTYHAAAEVRWYYQQKRDILTGKSGNNLSGDFIAVQSRYQDAVPGLLDIQIDPQPDLLSPFSFDTYNTIHLIWGIQQRILRNGYLQFKIGEGVAWVVRHEIKDGQRVKRERLGLDWSSLGELQIGFAF